MFQGRLKVFQGIFQWVSGNFKEVSKMSGAFQRSFKEVSMKFQGCFKGTSEKFEGCFKED